MLTLPYQSLPENQCLFVRGFRVVRVLNIWPRLRGEAGHAPGTGEYEPEPDKQLESIGTSADTNVNMSLIFQTIV